MAIKKAKKKAAVKKAKKTVKKAVVKKPVKAAKITKRKSVTPKAPVYKGTMVAVAALPPKVLKAIKDADAWEVKLLDAQDGFRTSLTTIKETIGTTFEHPDRGPMSIMIPPKNKDKIFWRRKPTGGPKGAKRKAEARKTIKIAARVAKRHK